MNNTYYERKTKKKRLNEVNCDGVKWRKKNWNTFTYRWIEKKMSANETVYLIVFFFFSLPAKWTNIYAKHIHRFTIWMSIFFLAFNPCSTFSFRLMITVVCVSSSSSSNCSRISFVCYCRRFSCSVSPLYNFFFIVSYSSKVITTRRTKFFSSIHCGRFQFLIRLFNLKYVIFFSSLDQKRVINSNCINALQTRAQTVTEKQFSFHLLVFTARNRIYYGGNGFIC